MAKFYLKKNFISLRNIWYKKLRDEGFKDKETFFNIKSFKYPGPYLIQSEYKRLLTSELKCDNYTKERFEEYRHYYTLCVEYLTNGDFKCEQHRKIFSMHIDGLSVRKIVEEIKLDDSFYVKLTKSSVHTIINYYKNLTLRANK